MNCLSLFVLLSAVAVRSLEQLTRVDENGDPIMGFCGDGFCDIGEECDVDCTVSTCGNAVCEASESCSSCPGDCGTCMGTDPCGNGLCEADEDCQTCSQDCGTCQLMDVCSPPMIPDASCEVSATNPYRANCVCNEGLHNTLQVPAWPMKCMSGEWNVGGYCEIPTESCPPLNIPGATCNIDSTAQHANCECQYGVNTLTMNPAYPAHCNANQWSVNGQPGQVGECSVCPVTDIPSALPNSICEDYTGNNVIQCSCFDTYIHTDTQTQQYPIECDAYAGWRVPVGECEATSPFCGDPALSTASCSPSGDVNTWNCVCNTGYVRADTGLQTFSTRCYEDTDTWHASYVECIQVAQSVTPTRSSAVTPSVTPTRTSAVTPSVTPTRTSAVTPSVTPTQTPTTTISTTPTVSTTRTSSVTASVSTTQTPTLTPTVTTTITRTPTMTPTVSPTWTPTASTTVSRTPTQSVSVTPSPSFIHKCGIVQVPNAGCTFTDTQAHCRCNDGLYSETHVPEFTLTCDATWKWPSFGFCYKCTDPGDPFFSRRVGTTDTAGFLTSIRHECKAGYWNALTQEEVATAKCDLGEWTPLIECSPCRIPEAYANGLVQATVLAADIPTNAVVARIKTRATDFLGFAPAATISLYCGPFGGPIVSGNMNEAYPVVSTCLKGNGTWWPILQCARCRSVNTRRRCSNPIRCASACRWGPWSLPDDLHGLSLYL